MANRNAHLFTGLRGFTLVEVMVTLAVTGIVIVATRVTYDAIGGGGAAVASTARRRDAAMNGERELRRLVAQTRVPTEAAPFDGGRDYLTFDTWCRSADEWQERCRVRIERQTRGERTSLILNAPGVRPFVLVTRDEPMEVRYVPSVDANREWAANWRSGTSAPIAIAIVTRRDTLVVRVGERG